MMMTKDAAIVYDALEAMIWERPKVGHVSGYAISYNCGTAGGLLRIACGSLESTASG
jgi:hypothetical protein